MAFEGVWPVPWAPYGRHGGVAGILDPGWLPWGLGWSPGPHMATVGAWPISWNPYVCRGSWPVSWVPYGCRGSVGGRCTPYGRRGGVNVLLGPV